MRTGTDSLRGDVKALRNSSSVNCTNFHQYTHCRKMIYIFMSLVFSIFRVYWWLPGVPYSFKAKVLPKVMGIYMTRGEIDNFMPGKIYTSHQSYSSLFGICIVSKRVGDMSMK